MKDYYVCFYCGTEVVLFSWMASNDKKCTCCGDSRLMLKKEALKSDVYGYKDDEEYRKRFPLE